MPLPSVQDRTHALPHITDGLDISGAEGHAAGLSKSESIPASCLPNRKGKPPGYQCPHASIDFASLDRPTVGAKHIGPTHILLSLLAINAIVPRVQFALAAYNSATIAAERLSRLAARVPKPTQCMSDSMEKSMLDDWVDVVCDTEDGIYRVGS